MAAAAHTKGGFGGVTQKVGREFNQADKGTGILNHKSSHMYRPKGYSRGGAVEAPKGLRLGGKAGFATGGMVNATYSADLAQWQAEQEHAGSGGGRGTGIDAGSGSSAAGGTTSGAGEISGPSGGPGETGADQGYAKGGKIVVGKIKHVAGKPIGKDDGLIPAQRGEFVVRRSAVKKLGVATLNEINKGHLPSSHRMYGRKAVSRGG